MMTRPISTPASPAVMKHVPPAHDSCWPLMEAVALAGPQNWRVCTPLMVCGPGTQAADDEWPQPGSDRALKNSGASERRMRAMTDLPFPMREAITQPLAIILYRRKTGKDEFLPKILAAPPAPSPAEMERGRWTRDALVGRCSAKYNSR